MSRLFHHGSVPSPDRYLDIQEPPNCTCSSLVLNTLQSFFVTLHFCWVLVSRLPRLSLYNSNARCACRDWATAHRPPPAYVLVPLALTPLPVPMSTCSNACYIADGTDHMRGTCLFPRASMALANPTQSERFLMLSSLCLVEETNLSLLIVGSREEISSVS